jgi:hypothetical protein
VIKTKGVWCELGSAGSAQGPVECSCYLGNETLDCVEGGEYLDQLSVYHFINDWLSLFGLFSVIHSMKNID